MLAEHFVLRMFSFFLTVNDVQLINMTVLNPGACINYKILHLCILHIEWQASYDWHF